MMRYAKEDLQAALQVLRSGGVILYPTDTIWGIGCDATCEAAVQRIFQLKQRSDSKSMLVLLDGPGKLQGYVESVPETAWMLLEATDVTHEDAAPETPQRPLTIIYPGAKNLAPSLVAEDGSIGIRITYENFTKALCEQLHRPIVSTSANISGKPSPKFFAEIEEEILRGVDYVCQYRQNDMTEHAPSSIIKINPDNTFQVIR